MAHPPQQQWQSQAPSGQLPGFSAQGFGQPWSPQSTGQGGPPSQGWSQPGGQGVPGGSPQPYQQQRYQQQGYQQQPYQQQGHQQQPGGPPRPGTGQPAGPAKAKTGNPLAKVLLGMIALVVVGIGALVVVGLVSGGGDVRYVNEDWTPPPPDMQPPPLPQPDTMGEAETWTTENAIYQQVMPGPVACDASPIDYESVSNDELEAHMNTIVGCLTGAWVGPVEAAGFQMPRPSVTVYSSETDTPCGELPMQNAVYCGNNQQIYFADDLVPASPTLQKSRYGGELVVAHEFGHAVQGRTGILISKYALQDGAASETEGYVFSRRNEAQADCFGALFLRSASRALGIEQSDVKDLEAISKALGGNKPGRTHPSGGSRLYWTQMGLSTDQISQCNTYTAPEETVV